MWRARHTLEEQVGGLVDHDEDDRRGRRRAGPVEPTEYPLARHGSAAIRAERAASPDERRQVA